MSVLSTLAIPFLFFIAAIGLGEVLFRWSNPSVKQPKPINMTKAKERIASVSPSTVRPSNGGYKGRGYAGVSSSSSSSRKSGSGSSSGWGGFDYSGDSGGGCSGGDGGGCGGGD